MKKWSVLEAVIISFLGGIAVSAYVTFVVGSGGVLGPVLSFLSFKSFLKDSSLTVSFLLFILIYGVYVYCIVRLLERMPTYRLYIWIVLCVLVASIVFDQQRVQKFAVQEDISVSIPRVATSTRKVTQSLDTYFGQETRGDLNLDGRDDIAFILHRKDPERGDLYYLSAALATTTGFHGVDIAFLGDEFKPKELSIKNSFVHIVSDKKQTLFAELIKNVFSISTTSPQ